MKILSFLLSGLCMIFLATNAQAEYKTFGPDNAKFKIDVPEGWTATENSGGAQLTAGDGGSSISIQVQPSGGKSAKELANIIAEQMKKNNGKVINIEEANQNQASIYFEIDGTRVATLIVVNGDKFVAITMAGKDGDTMKKIVDSLQDAE